jgi:hypothetical protein
VAATSHFLYEPTFHLAGQPVQFIEFLAAEEIHARDGEVPK